MVTLACFLFFRQNPNRAVFVVGNVFSPVATAAWLCYIKITLKIIHIRKFVCVRAIVHVRFFFFF